VCTALIYTSAGAKGLGTNLLASWSSQPAVRQFAVTGVIQAKNGDVWTIDGRDYTIDPLSVHGGSTNVGDSISLTVSVEQSTAMPQATETPVPGGTPSTPTHKEMEISGVVTAIDAASITIDGVVYSLSPKSELHSGIMVGDTVKLEFFTNSDGTFTAHEVEKPEMNSSETETGSVSTGGKHHSEDDNHSYTNTTGQPGQSGYSDDDDEHEHSQNNGGSNGSSHDGDDE
jgi:hypothetical protein